MRAAARSLLRRARWSGGLPSAAPASRPAVFSGATRWAGFSSATGQDVQNPHLKNLGGDDYLYHLGLNPAEHDMPGLFGDVKFVCMGGSPGRMTQFAESATDEIGGSIGIEIPFGMRPSPVGKQDRFVLYKVGPVLISSHGMGQPSMSILLHEVTKLLHYAGAKDATYIRLGTSGGVGVDPGTVVVSTEGASGTLDNKFRLPILGEMVERPSLYDADVVQGVLDAVARRPETSDFVPGKNIVQGKTMAADCFYEGQGRLDGAICDYDDSDKMNFLKRAHEYGVRNIEMESLLFGSFTHRLGIKAVCCCVTLLNRLEGDQVRSTHEQLQKWENAPGRVALAYIKDQLNIPPPEKPVYKALWTVAAH